MKENMATHWFRKVVSLILKIFWICPIRENKIFFISFNGACYGYDTKAIIEYIEKYFPSQYDMVIGYKKIENFKKLELPDIRLTRLNSVHALYEMLTSKVLIYSINPPSYLPVRDGQILCNTWHGFPFKRIGKYVKPFNRKQFAMSTIFLSHGKYFTDVAIRESFLFDGEVLDSGLPRNDIFFSDDMEKIDIHIKRRYGIAGKKILLYAPTFRNVGYRDSGINMKSLLEEMHHKFGGEWVAMYRLHPRLRETFQMNLDIGIDVTLHEDMQELLCAADVLVTDYSSIMWDYSLMQKPIFIFAPDISEYSEERGFYIRINDWPFPIAESNDELIRNVNEFVYEEYCKRVSGFMNEMGSYEEGHACQRLMDYIRCHS